MSLDAVLISKANMAESYYVDNDAVESMLYEGRTTFWLGADSLVKHSPDFSEVNLKFLLL